MKRGVVSRETDLLSSSSLLIGDGSGFSDSVSRVSYIDSKSRVVS